MALNWTEETFSIPYLSEQVEFPQLIKIASLTDSNCCDSRSANFVLQTLCDTHSQSTSEKIPSTNSLHVGDVLKLHGARTFKKAVLTGASRYVNGCEEVATEYGYLSPPGNTSIYRQYSVPISFSTPLKLLPYQDPRHIYHTAGDIIDERPRPKSVIVNKKIVLAEKHCVIKEGDVLAIISIDKRCTSSGVVDFLICKHNDKTVGLPTTCVGDFTVNCEETLYSLSNVVDKHLEFPQRVCFQSDESKSLCQTLIRGGEKLVVPGEEYVIENVIKQQYLICTKCEANVSLGQTKLYFIPTNSTLSKSLHVHLPLFHDIKSYRMAVNSLYCANLSMKNIIDCTPIEAAGDPKLVIRNLGDVYDVTGPELPPRKDPSNMVLSGTENDKSSVGKQGAPPNFSGRKDRFGKRLNASESNLAGMTLTDVTLACHKHSSSQKYTQCEQMSSEDQPLLGGNSPSANRHHVEGASSTPIFSRRGTSTPCTPESRRRKTDSPQTWSEKISMSLENLKRAFRKPGSDERDKPSRIGDGSQLADSFENLSMTGESADQTQNLPVTGSNYENVQLVAAQLSKPAGRPRPLKSPPSSSGVSGGGGLGGGVGLGGMLQSRCSQIKEIWTPPCSPDYRDHTTSYLQQHPPIPAVGLHQFNNSNSNQLVSPRKTERHLAAGNDEKPPSTSTESAVFNFTSSDTPSHHASHKSPIAAPRQSKENLQSLSARALYENIEAAVVNRSTPNAGLTPPSRCSGYSSGSRGSSENDLVTASQLDSSAACSATGDWIGEDLSALSVSGLADCLRQFELPNVANKFKQHQIDGQFFNIMSDHMFRDENFSFSEFEILKLKRLRDGWRPRLG